MAERMRLGFVGLGNLGAPIAENLLQSGHELYVYNRTPSKSIPLKEKGAIVCDGVASLARQVDLVFTMVSDDAALKNIVQGKDGLLENGRPGQIHVSMSTILPVTAEAMESLYTAQNKKFLAAPVFGRPEAARARKLNFVLSGDEITRKAVEPLLKDAGAAGIFDFGNRITAANTVKLCGNFLIAAALEAMGECLALGKESGVDVQQMWSMLTQTLFTSPVYVNYGNIVLQQKFEPAAFTAKLGLKDMNLVLSQAASVNQPMPLANLLKNNLQELVESGRENIDWSAMSIVSQKNKPETVVHG
ncbi:MAG TPA: NAD(P)-dependent oxidoreductase [Puia sp.]|nr:NAD(P)-dependent oxidoreductase [Puia sp.]